MKIFLSWSGTKSHKVALVLKEWLPSVIQSIEPYVSSEDIDKGARWSTDIAKELENSTFGILCVTKDNLNAPWLTFEAGALSKTMDKSFVCPFLFDIKRSEVDGPILQFQSTILEKEDIKKLLKTINKACGESKLTDKMLDNAFDVWFPTLDSNLNKLKEVKDEQHKGAKKEENLKPEILEEILELVRSNTKLLRNPDPTINNSIEEINSKMQDMFYIFKEDNIIKPSRNAFKMSMMFLEDLIHISDLKEGPNKYIPLLVFFSQLKEPFPWVYDLGKELIDILKSRKTKEEKHMAINDSIKMIDNIFHLPMIREIGKTKKEYYMLYKDLPFMLEKIMMRYL